jgi:hypothetical protein
MTELILASTYPRVQHIEGNQEIPDLLVITYMNYLLRAFEFAHSS